MKAARKKMRIRKIFTILISVFLVMAILVACTKPEEPASTPSVTEITETTTAEDDSEPRIVTVGAETKAIPGKTVRFKVTPISASGESWSITGNSSKDTYIDQDGTLTVAKDEAAKKLIITAVSKANVNASIFIEIPIEQEAESTTEEQSSSETTESTSEQRDVTFVLDTGSKTYHLPSCQFIKDIAANKKQDFFGSNTEAEIEGYVPCGTCNPAGEPTSPTEEASTEKPTGQPTQPTQPAPTHVHEYWSEVTYPTCWSGGYTTHYCSCGDSYVDNYTAALGHNWAMVTESGASCDRGGYRGYQCTRCGEYYEESTSGALGHNYVVVSESSPTCTSGGYRGYQCTRCGSYYEESTGGALGHNFSGGSCTRCGAADPNYTPPACDHNWVYTSSGDGSAKIRRCTKCGALEIVN